VQEKKLKQEERLVILKKLSYVHSFRSGAEMDQIFISHSDSQAQLSSSLNLQSSSTLGTGRALTNKERLEKSENDEVKRAIAGRTGKRKRSGDDYAVVNLGGSDDESEDQDSDSSAHSDRQSNVDMARSEGLPDGEFGTTSQHTNSIAVGNALRRNADGSVEVPKVVKSKVKGKTVCLPYTHWSCLIC
jgi:ATP-dependent RNA helicase DHX37/DHR1